MHLTLFQLTLFSSKMLINWIIGPLKEQPDLLYPQLWEAGDDCGLKPVEHVALPALPPTALAPEPNLKFDLKLHLHRFTNAIVT